MQRLERLSKALGLGMLLCDDLYACQAGGGWAGGRRRKKKKTGGR